MSVMVKNSAELFGFMCSLCLDYVAGLIGNDAGVTHGVVFVKKLWQIILNDFIGGITGNLATKLANTSTSLLSKAKLGKIIWL